MAALAQLWPLSLPLILLIPALGGFPYSSDTSPYSDLAVTHYPYAFFLQRSLLRDGIFPLWSPGILSGHPFAANPLSGLWYPPGWLALALPLPFGLNLLAAAHLVWGGLGLYKLLRIEGLGHPAGLFGGLAFELMPKLFAHYGAGHLTLLYAVSWTPWLVAAVAGKKLYGVVQARDRFAAGFKLIPSIVLALIFLADPRWAPFAGALWWSYVFAHSLPGHLKSRSLVDPLKSLLTFLIPQTLLAFLLAAPLALPLLEFTRLSTRALLAPSDVFTFSLPPSRLLGLVIPTFSGFHEWVLYPGGAVLILAVLAFQEKNWGEGHVRRQDVLFWSAVAILSLIFSLGEALPLLPGLGRLPGLNLLRVPSRALFLLGLSMALLAAFMVERLNQFIGKNPERRLRLWLTGLAGFPLILSLGVWALTRNIPLSFLWGAGSLLAVSLWTGLFLGGRLPSRIWNAGLFGLLCLDLIAVDHSLFSPRPANTVLSEGQIAIQYLQAQPGFFRIYSPSYSLPQQSAAQAGLELASGVDPLQLEAYSAFMEAASGVPRSGYSVTQPSISGEDPATANRTYRPNPRLLGLLNVRYVVSEYDLPAEGLALVRKFGDTRVYENLLFLPRAWTQPLDASPGEGARPAAIYRWSPNQIELEASAGGEGGLLVLSELAYPGWRVWIDGQPAGIQTVAGLLRGVELDPGEHRVTFAFLPASVYCGLGLSGLGILSIFIVGYLNPNRKRISFLTKE